MIDLKHSRRTYQEECRWWSRNEDDEFTPDELIMKRIPTGYFRAKESAPVSDRDNIVGGTFMVGSSKTTIKSPDNLDGMEPKDIVEYQGEKWLVVDVQKTVAKVSNTAFANTRNYRRFWYVELRK